MMGRRHSWRSAHPCEAAAGARPAATAHGRPPSGCMVLRGAPSAAPTTPQAQQQQQLREGKEDGRRRASSIGVAASQGWPRRRTRAAVAPSALLLGSSGSGFACRHLLLPGRTTPGWEERRRRRRSDASSQSHRRNCVRTNESYFAPPRRWKVVVRPRRRSEVWRPWPHNTSALARACFGTLRDLLDQGASRRPAPPEELQRNNYNKNNNAVVIMMLMVPSPGARRNRPLLRPQQRRRRRWWCDLWPTRWRHRRSGPFSVPSSPRSGSGTSPPPEGAPLPPARGWSSSVPGPRKRKKGHPPPPRSRGTVRLSPVRKPAPPPPGCPSM